ncbi:MAG TPA: hypothetical protein VFB62_24060 [Polyangiaceae bacterium]|jgi:hypothetical protein|nr:hypothetical protein [Polyangiaceae bacterium]
MPYKSIASLKKLGNLGAEVVGLAALETGQIAAAVTTDPVKVAIYSYSGGSPKITNVSLDEAGGVALINKQVAVVKSGDAIWALLDIQHKAKMEQIGRDIRSLHACPDGETALAIGWDGNGAALVFQNNEVGGRQFVLRGDVRAASLRDRMTYVVVDGSGGGQLRAHPGTTPESGANARVDLPPTAAAHDRLAGGHELSALARRGSDEVCVVLREGASALTVKTLRIGAGVISVEVLGSSLFALGADGRLRLFDGDTLRAATDGGTPSATFELGLGAQGEPSAMIATVKGGARLWIGTRGGDVLRCDPVKGTGLDLAQM